MVFYQKLSLIVYFKMRICKNDTCNTFSSEIKLLENSSFIVILTSEDLFTKRSEKVLIFGIFMSSDIIDETNSKKKTINIFWPKKYLKC